MPRKEASNQMPDDEVIVSEGERWIYHVRSRTNAKIRYRVDLLGMGGASQCACADWNFVAVENITLGKEWGIYGCEEKKDPDRTCCYHTDVVRRRYMNELTRRLAKQEDNPPHR